MLAFMIIPRYGHNLDSIFTTLNYKFNTDTILDLGLTLITTFEAIHKCGLIYNDLKLDNILIGFNSKVSTSGSSFKNLDLHLIDFGFCSKYIKNGSHIAQAESQKFRGNMMFASMDQLDFKTPSRRDDMISLCYLLSFLLNEGKLKDINFESEME